VRFADGGRFGGVGEEGGEGEEVAGAGGAVGYEGEDFGDEALLDTCILWSLVRYSRRWLKEAYKLSVEFG